MNMKTPEQILSLKKKRGVARKIIKHGVQLPRDQVNRGGHVAWEWPRNNLGWSDTELKSFFHSLALKACYM